MLLGLRRVGVRKMGEKRGGERRGEREAERGWREWRVRNYGREVGMTEEKLLEKRPSKGVSDKRRIDSKSLLDFSKYGEMRRSVYYPLKRLLKKDRMLMLGPYATVTFENYDLMWLQTMEMIFVENSDPEEELAAYNPLVPNGNNLIVTLMFEIENPVRREQVLRSLGHVEDTLSLELDGKFKINASSVDGHDIERTSADGKTSAVHFLKFDLDSHQKALFHEIANRNQGDAILSFSHQNYPHSTKIPIQTIKNIAQDLL